MIFNGAYWGTLLIFLGISIILKYLFNIHFPIFRILFAIFFIFLGFKILFGSFSGIRSSNSVVFSEANLSYSPGQKEYGCVFGKSSFDLSSIEIQENKIIEVNAVFGEINVKLNRNSNIEIQSSTAFGQVTSPDHSNVSFGSNNYHSENNTSSQPILLIKANAVFGSVKFFY